MMKIKQIGLSLIAILILGFSFASCERSYDDPKLRKIYTDSDFENETMISIKDLKQVYYDKVGYDGAIVKGLEVTKNYVIKGKIVSNDEYGNVYRTVYIQDETGAIEVKTGLTGFYTYFSPGETVYVMCKGLYLGNYRFMISIGAKAITNEYSNGFMDAKVFFSNDKKLGSVFLQGEKTKLEEKDITIVVSPNDLHDGLLGRLVEFKGLRHTEGEVNRNQYPSFLEQKKSTQVGGAADYMNYTYRATIAAWNQFYSDSIKWEHSGRPNPKPKRPAAPKPDNMQGATYAFKNTGYNLNYFGSALFKFGDSETDPTHNMIVRSSGYSRFANELLPEDGAIVDITAIYTKFSDKSGGNISYQLLLNNSRDVKER